MNSAATTTCCGVVLAVGLTLPVGQQPTPQSSHVGPTAIGFQQIWQQRLEVTGTLRLTPVAGAVVVSGPEGATHVRAADTGELRWSDARASAIPPAVAGDYLFFATQSQLVALALATGREVWTTEIDDAIVSVVARGDIVVLASSTGVWFTKSASIRVLQAKDGRQLWSKAVSTPLSAAPAIDDGRLFVATRTATLDAWDLSTGAPQWQASAGTPLGELFIQAGRLYARGDPEGFFAYRQNRPWPRWYTLRGQLIGQPAVDDQRVYVAGLDNTIVAMDRDSGTRKWKTNLAGRPLSGPILAGEMVMAPLTSGAIVSLSRKDGKVMAGATSGDETARPPEPVTVAATADGTMIFAVTKDAGGVHWLSALRRSR